jgi:hypothetical protein
MSLDKFLKLACAVRGIPRITINWTANARLFAFAFLKYAFRIFAKCDERDTCIATQDIKTAHSADFFLKMSNMVEYDPLSTKNERYTSGSDRSYPNW